MIVNLRQAGNKTPSELRSKLEGHKAALAQSGYINVGSNTVTIIKKNTFQLYRYCISMSLVGLSRYFYIETGKHAETRD